MASMFTRLTDRSRRLDEWLETNLGRPYNAVLTVGLMLELSQKLQTLPGTLTHAGGLAGLLFALAVQSALLIHQLGEFSHRREKRRTREAAVAQGAGDGPPVEGPHEESLRLLGRWLRQRLRRRD
jgi:hypothetical protein